MPDPTAEQVIEAARKRWPEATRVSVTAGGVRWDSYSDWNIERPAVYVLGSTGRIFGSHADTLAALLQQIEKHDE